MCEISQDFKGNVQRMGPSVAEFKEVHSDFYLWSLYLRCQAKCQSNFIACLNMKIETFINKLLDYSYGVSCWQSFFCSELFTHLILSLGILLTNWVGIFLFRNHLLCLPKIRHFLLSTAHFNITSRNQDRGEAPRSEVPF